MVVSVLLQLVEKMNMKQLKKHGALAGMGSSHRGGGQAAALDRG